MFVEWQRFEAYILRRDGCVAKTGVMSITALCALILYLSIIVPLSGRNDARDEETTLGANLAAVKR